MLDRSVRQRLFLQVLADYGAVVVIMVGVILLYLREPADLLPMITRQGLSVATWLFLVGSASGIYEPHRNGRGLRIALRTVLAALVGLPVAVIFVTMLPSTEHQALVSFAATGAVMAVIVYRVYALNAGASSARTRVLVVGGGPAGQRVARTLSVNPYAEVVGHFAAPNEAAGGTIVTMPAGDGALAEAALARRVDEIVVAVSDRRGGTLPMRELLDCRVHGIRVWDMSTFYEKALGQIRLECLNAGWLVFGDGFRQGAVRTALKRVFDILGALALLVAVSPLMALVACLIPLESGGPVLYRQTRVGLNGRHFEVLKFRSMRADAEGDGQPRWASTVDDRVTRLGALMRLMRIDELPQLFNVLAGHMSLVGPRPERPYFVEQLAQQVPYYGVRHSVKPGITGWAQVRYHYGATVEDAVEKLQYDLYYVKNHSVWLDGMILFETVGVVLTGKGAR